MQLDHPSTSAPRLPPQLWPYLMISLALHACLAVPWVYSLLRPHARPETRQLVLDLAGIQSQRQMERQIQQTPPPPKPLKVPTRQPAPSRPEQVTRSSPEDIPIAPKQPAAAEAKAVPAPQPVAHDAQATAEQHIAPPESAETLKGRYALILSRAIQHHLAYPANARELSLTGDVVISFSLTAEGDIRPGSLNIKASSGSALLDESALRAARDAAPFQPPPPNTYTLSITLKFSREG